MELDVVILGIQRTLAKNCLEAFLEHVNHQHYTINLIMHLDYVQELNESGLRKKINVYKKYFNNFTLKMPKKNIGHTRSFLWCINQVKKDCIYLEDDKIFFQTLNINDIYESGFDAFSLSGFKGKLGNTNANFYKFKVIKYLRENYLPEQKWKDTEKNNKAKLKRTNFSYFNSKAATVYCRDMGAEYLADRGFIRVRQGHRCNLPSYIRPPDITYIINSLNYNKLNSQNANFYLGLLSFQTFYTQDDVFDMFLCSRVTGKYMGIISTLAEVTSAVTYDIPYSSFEKYDVIGSPNTYHYVCYVRTKYFMRNIQFYNGNIYLALRDFFYCTNLKILELTHKDLGFKDA